MSEDKISPAQHSEPTPAGGDIDIEGKHHVELDQNKRVANAALDALSEARSPRKVLVENKKNLLLILAVQVRRSRGRGDCSVTRD